MISFNNLNPVWLFKLPENQRQFPKYGLKPLNPILYLHSFKRWICGDDSLVIIPTFNEKENVEKWFGRFFHFRKFSMCWLLMMVLRMEPRGHCKKIVTEFPKFYRRKKRETWIRYRVYSPASNGPLPEVWLYFRDGLWFSTQPGWSFQTLYSLCEWRRRHVDQFPLHSQRQCSQLAAGRSGDRFHYASVYVRFGYRDKIKDTTAGFICYTRKNTGDNTTGWNSFYRIYFPIEMKFTATWNADLRSRKCLSFSQTERKERVRWAKGFLKKRSLGVMQMKWKVYSTKYPKISKPEELGEYLSLKNAHCQRRKNRWWNILISRENRKVTTSISHDGAQFIDVAGKFVLRYWRSGTFSWAGLTHKAEIYTESKSSSCRRYHILHGNAKTPSRTHDTERCWKTNTHLLRRNRSRIILFHGELQWEYGRNPSYQRGKMCGVKIFMGSSTGKHAGGCSCSIGGHFVLCLSPHIVKTKQLFATI